MEGGGYGGGAKWDTGDTGDAPENGIITARQLKGGAERHCDAPYSQNEWGHSTDDEPWATEGLGSRPQQNAAQNEQLLGMHSCWLGTFGILEGRSWGTGSLRPCLCLEISICSERRAAF